ncbi:MAG: C69 family dipeptidase [Synergistaceae bacterium]|nr:C69 family dipeptidase [Synergistaceae bacterium]
MCMTILAGRRASASGEVLVGHNEDAPGRFIMQTHLVKKKRRHPGTTITFEPNLSALELYDTRTNLFWAEAQTFSDDPSDSAFCDLYVNGHGVVICTNNCADSREDSPELLDGGIGYGLRRLVAERAHDAREALEIACGLVDKYGYASSGRSYSFADKNEIFVMQIVHGKHYAVERVPDDEVAVIPNHYTIHDPDKKAQGYNELVNYAEKRGWFKPEEYTFDFARVFQSPESYGLDKNTYRHIRAFEVLLEMDLSDLKWQKWQGLPFSIKPAHKVSVETMKAILRSHEQPPHFAKPLTICNTETLESTIVEIRDNPDRITIRKALGRPAYSPYLVWYMGMLSDPEGYEDVEADESLAQHFSLKPEAMDWRNNAWFRAMEVQAACEMLSEEKEKAVCAKIAEFEKQEERELSEIDGQIELSLRYKPNIARAMMEGSVMKWSDGVKDLMTELRDALGIITGEAVNAVNSGENFRVKLDGIDPSGLEAGECICGPSYAEYSSWSKCAGISGGCIEFTGGEWLKDATPCFTDLYMLLVGKDGSRRAGRVCADVRR